MSSAGRKRRRLLKPICHSDMTPFLSIQLVLLSIFVAPIVTWRDLPRGFSEGLPKVSHFVSMSGANREDAMIVGIMRTGDIWFGDERLITVDALPPAIREGLKRGAERKVYLRADARAKYGRIREVLTAIRSAGVENLGFLVDQRKAPTSFK